MNSSSLVGAEPQKTRPICFRGDIDDILRSAGNNLAASHRDPSLAGADNCSLSKPPGTKHVCVRGRRGSTLIQRIRRCRIRGHLLLAAGSRWTAVKL